MEEFFSPYHTGSVLSGGYRIERIGPARSGSISVVIKGPDGVFTIRFFKKNPSIPHFTTTENCTIVYYESTGKSNMPTPERLALAINDLRSAVSSHDELCQRVGNVVYPFETGRGDANISFSFAVFLIAVFLFLSIGSGYLLSVMPARMRESLFWFLVALIAIAGIQLRMRNLYGFFDEGAFTQRLEIAASPLYEILKGVARDYRHPPLTYVVLHFILYFGSTEPFLRLFFVAMSVASIPLYAEVGRRAGGISAGVGSTVIVSLFPSVVQIGSEIGSHALYLFVAPAWMLSYMNFRKHPELKNFIILCLLTVLSCWSHYVSFFFVVLILFGLIVRCLVGGFRWEGILPEGKARKGYFAAGGVTAVFVLISFLGALRGFIQDMKIKEISTIYGVVWGKGGAVGVLGEFVNEFGRSYFLVFLSFFLLSSILLFVEFLKWCKRGCLTGWSYDAVVVTIFSWIGILAFIFISPFVRIRGSYFVLNIGFLSIACLKLVDLVSNLIFKLCSNLQYKLGGLIRRSCAGLLLGIFCCYPVWHWVQGQWMSSQNYEEEDECGICKVAPVIKESSVKTIVLVYGFAASQLGYYLLDRTVRKDFSAGVKKWDSAVRYGSYKIYTLIFVREVRGGWRKIAEDRLKRIIQMEGRVFLVSSREERVWDGLVRAGNCRACEKIDGVDLLICP